ncbi:hypothetical protein AX17_004652 [Amanita inopinata Kibby_2008]|nr:hypothetical protein AX17_004652 [Amanita inopinata Kibby_2008]
MPAKPTAIAPLSNTHDGEYRAASPTLSVSSSSSAGLYVPVHKRRSTSSTRTHDSMSVGSSSRPSSRAESHSDYEHVHEHVTEIGYHPFVYSRDRLLALAKSPLAHMPNEVKDGLREAVPEIVMSRRHRKAMEYRARPQQQQQQRARSPAQPQVQPQSQAPQQEQGRPRPQQPVPAQRPAPRRSRPLGRVSKWNATKAAGEEMSWRRVNPVNSISVA